MTQFNPEMSAGSVRSSAIFKTLHFCRPQSVSHHSPRPRSSYAIILLSIGLLFSSLSCNEELPPYTEPETLLTATLEGEYWLGEEEHSLRVSVRVTNIYEETLEGPASLTGTITIVAARDPTVKKTLMLKSQNLIWGNYSSDGVLRIDPKSTITLQAVWLFPADSELIGNNVFIDDGRDIAHNRGGVAPFMTFVKDSTCGSRKLALPEDLLLQATLTVFSKKGPISTETVVFPLCLISNWVSTKLCPHIATRPPCGYWRR
ncbi:MAG: hypothetical protein HW389_1458 [Bacteroidetes bacterium]|nr:hypothetical protein [Bacteroidota bacterium]